MKDNDPDYTPVIRGPRDHWNLWIKRDDTYRLNGIAGGKVRACRAIAEAGNGRGLVTASARKSPQMQIVARLAARMGLPCRLHTASGADTPEMVDAREHGGTLVQHRPGYNSVIMARAEADAKERDWTYIPFGMEHKTALECTRKQAVGLAYENELSNSNYFKRIVICVGSGMSAAGLLWGLRDLKWDIPVLGVRIGADPTKRLDRWAPAFWQTQMKVVTSRFGYTEAVKQVLGTEDGAGILLDPHYEGKCYEHLQDGDLFWIVGIRAGLSEH